MKESAAKDNPTAVAGRFARTVNPYNTRQDAFRQWILLIPLATAAAGVAATQLGESYIDYLSPLFFVGALLITAAMIQQRQVYRQIEGLSESLQVANEYLDTLHRLQFDLNQSLEVSQVSQSVLNHMLEALGAPSGALWLREQFDFGVAQLGNSYEARKVSLIVSRGQNWHLAAAEGWDTPARQEVLESWNRLIDEATECTECHLGVKDGLQGDDWLREGILAGELPSSAIAVPVCWKGENIGVLIAARWDKEFHKDDATLLREVALVTGPALENALLYQRTLTRADFDGLTNLLNHRAIQERLTQELARAQRARITNPDVHFAIALFDLTDFKLFNDTYGHAMGDEVLRTVSRTLRSTFRISDIVARYGGDEFLAVLPEADSQGAMVIAARVIEAIKGQVFKADDGSNIVIRATCGIAVYPQDGEAGADLFQSADARLYEAKQAGVQLIPYVRVQTEKDPKLGAASLWGHFGVLDALMTAIDNRDHYTRAHSEQTMCYALLVAQEMGQPLEMLDAVRISGLLYDIGKIAVPDAILRKPGLLSADEKFLMQQHCRFGSMMVQEVEHHDRVLEGVQSHHEAFDGSGYPNKLAGESIPWIARLLAVADGFSAMTTDRPYRKALSPGDALNELKRMRGKQFDPAFVDAFERVLDDVIAGDSTLQLKLQQALEICNKLIQFHAAIAAPSLSSPATKSNQPSPPKPVSAIME